MPKNPPLYILARPLPTKKAIPVEFRWVPIYSIVENWLKALWYKSTSAVKSPVPKANRALLGTVRLLLAWLGKKIDGKNSPDVLTLGGVVPFAVTVQP